MLPILIGTFTLSSTYTLPSNEILPFQSQHSEEVLVIENLEITEPVEEEVVTEEVVKKEANPVYMIETREEVAQEGTSGVSLAPGLVPICHCESGSTQFNKDGTVLRGRVNPQDVGICQINLKYHSQAAEEQGIDLFTLEGNITYANRLYASQGAQPWSASASCHGQY